MTGEDTNPTIPHHSVWLVPVGMLLIALFSLPYGFYTILRIVVSAAASYLAYFEYEQVSLPSSWSVLLIVLAVVFNPVIPIHLTREIWLPINVGTAIVFIIHWRHAHE